MNAARFVEKVCNRKLARVNIEKLEGDDVVRYAGHAFDRRPHAVRPFCSATSASMAATCPDACVFKRTTDGKGGGCFADSGFTRMAGKKMDAAAVGMSPFEVILEEVELIDAAFPRGVPQDGGRGGRDLRLHTFGDVQTPGAALLLGEAAARWRKRGGGAVWSYTHSWREIERAAWGGAVSVLASIERPEQVKQAQRMGYAPAVVVPEFPNGKRPFAFGGATIVPCPAESLGKTCIECRLCLDVDLSAKGLGIGFAVHGWGAEIAKAQLVPLKTRRVAA